MENDRAALRAAVSPFEVPRLRRGLVQIATSMGLYLGTVGLMYWSLGISYFLTLALAVPATAFLVRVFIVQHDCGHGSFFASKRGNDILGAICGVLTLAPYAHWRRQHAGHHANWNNLDRRESGADIYSVCLTVAEYGALSPRQRFFYRFWRHPLFANVLFPPLVFLLLYRLPFDTPKTWTRERRSVWTTDLAIVAVFWRSVRGIRAQRGIAGATADHRPHDNVGRLAVLGPASLRRCALVAQGRVEFRRSGVGRIILPALAAHPALGDRQYRVSPHPSPVARVPNYRLAECYRSSALFQPENRSRSHGP